jgi:hypothetical protein
MRLGRPVSRGNCAGDAGRDRCWPATTDDPASQKTNCCAKIDVLISYFELIFAEMHFFRFLLLCSGVMPRRGDLNILRENSRLFPENGNTNPVYLLRELARKPLTYFKIFPNK